MSKTKSQLEITKQGWGGGKDLVFEDFIKKYQKKLGPKILDIGSGEGRRVIMLAKKGFDVVGLELTKAGTSTACKRLKANKLQATLILGDAHTLPFIDSYFDSIISIQVFQFNDWKGARLCFTEASRVLKKKGLFFLRVKSISAEVPRRNKKIKDVRGATYRTPDGNKAHWFTAGELAQLGKSSGFKIIDGPFDLAPHKKEQGQWNVVYQKI